MAAGAELETPLGLAVLDEKFNLIKLLLTYGGDVNHITSCGDTILIKSTSKTKAIKFVKVLLAYGADSTSFSLLTTLRPSLILELQRT